MKGYLVAVILTVLFSMGQAQTADTTCRSVIAKNDSLKTSLFLSNYKIEKVRYYLKIVKRKPSQRKYIVGWVTRAIE